MADWMKCVSDMGTWYGNNINSYQGAASNKIKPRTPKYVLCPLINGNVRDDCSGYVVACMILAGIVKTGTSYCASNFASTNGACANALKAAGFQPMSFKASLLQTGDIYAHSHHVEICAGPNMQWGWGNNHYGNMPCKTGYSGSWTSGAYTTIWRLGGSATNSQGLTYNSSLVGQYSGTSSGGSSGGASYTNGDGTFNGSSWSKPKDGGVYNLGNAVKINGNSSGIIVGTHLNQK